MHTVFAGSTVRIFMIRFTGTAGTMTLIMIPFTIHHGTPQHGRIPGTGDGDTAGTHPIVAGDMAIHPITVTGTDLITEWVIPTTIHGITADIIQATTVVTTTADGMPILITTGTGKEEQPEPMYVTEITNHAVHLPLLHVLMAQQPKAAETVK